MNKTLLSIIVACILVSVPLGTWYLVGIDVPIPEELGKTLFTTLIQVNATLIGFYGIIMVFNWTKYSTTSNMFMGKAIETLQEIQLLEKDINNADEKEAKVLIEKRNVYVKNLNDSTEIIKDETKESVAFGNFSIVPVASFVASIIFSLIAITQYTTNSVTTEWLMIPFTPMFWGIVFTVLSIGSSYPSKKKDNFPTKGK